MIQRKPAAPIWVGRCDLPPHGPARNLPIRGSAPLTPTPRHTIYAGQLKCEVHRVAHPISCVGPHVAQRARAG